MILVKPSDLDRRLARQWESASTRDRNNISHEMRRRYEAAANICKAWDRSHREYEHQEQEISECDFRTIADAVSRVTKVSIADIRGHSRKCFITPARKIFCSIAFDSRRCGGPSLSMVARYLSRDHTTVLYSVISVANNDNLLLLAKSVISSYLPMALHHRLDANVRKYAGKKLTSQR